MVEDGLKPSIMQMNIVLKYALFLFQNFLFYYLSLFTHSLTHSLSLSPPSLSPSLSLSLSLFPPRIHTFHSVIFVLPSNSFHFLILISHCNKETEKKTAIYIID